MPVWPYLSCPHRLMDLPMRVVTDQNQQRLPRFNCIVDRPRHSPSPSHRPLSLTFFCCCLPISFSTMRARQIETRIVVWIIQCTSEGISPRHSLTRPGSLLLLPTTLQLLTVSNFFLYHRIRTQIDFTLACLTACLPSNPFGDYRCHWMVVCEPARNFNEPASMWAN